MYTTEIATFAGGCFWCMQPPYDELDGIIQTTVGYTGGSVAHPTYDEVCTGQTGHYEAVQILYDPRRVSYQELLAVFWRSVDPTDPYGQFADKGSQYRSAIFYHDEKQRRMAEESKNALAASGKFSEPVATLILPAGVFYPAEEYHQKYSLKNRLHYSLYKSGSGREGFLRKTWSKNH